jgi:hypothetical protein
MADVRLSVENASVNGLAESYTSVNSSDTYIFNNDGRIIVRVDNQDASDETVTITTPRTLAGGLTIEDPTVTVGSSSQKIIGPFPPGIYNEGQDVNLSFSNGTSTTVAVVKVA